MAIPKIGESTREEREAYVHEEWRCLHNCEMCGRCSMLRGNAEKVYADYIDGRREYMDITFELRSRNY